MKILAAYCGDRGIRLSAGERQRIGLARALLRDPVLLVLDEVTSALDWESDQLVVQTLKLRRSRKRSTLVVSHRMQLAAAADQVLVFAAGKIEQRGSHEELLSQPGMYARLWDLQRGEGAARPQAGEKSP